MSKRLPPPLDPTPASLRADQVRRADHLVLMAEGCPYCLVNVAPVCPDCYRCVKHGGGCEHCRPVRNPPPGGRVR